MITIGCAGFSVPATRYFKDFGFVEIQETQNPNPGLGTIKRWRREAPEAFEFAVLAPREIGTEGFREGKVTETALEAVRGIGDDLRANTLVLLSPPEFGATKANKAALKGLLAHAKTRFKRIVWEPAPSWAPDEAESLAEAAGAICAVDPLTQGIRGGRVGYYRLQGPAGKKSRYEDPAIERLAELVGEMIHEETVLVFANIDMTADAKRLKKALKMA